MDYLPVVFSTVLIILVIILSVVGVQLVLVLLEVKRTLKTINRAVTTAEDKINVIVKPLQNLGGMAAGLGTGMKVFEAFVGWLQRSSDSSSKK